MTVLYSRFRTMAAADAACGRTSVEAREAGRAGTNIRHNRQNRQLLPKCAGGQSDNGDEGALEAIFIASRCPAIFDAKG